MTDEMTVDEYRTLYGDRGTGRRRSGEPIRLTLPYPPSSNRYWRYVGGHPTLSADAKAYRTACGWAAKQQISLDVLWPEVEFIAGPMAVTLHFYRPQKTGDLDNRIKQCLDALNGVIWTDDSLIVEIHAYRHDDKANPRVEVEITEINNHG
jgi:crossover junction endodeoxyribonuclease RusA